MAIANSSNPLTAKPAPKLDLSQPADRWAVIPDVSALSADPDLDGTAGYPPFAPQRLILTAATALAVVLTDEDGDQFTVTVPAAGVVQIDRPIKLIDESASGAVQVIMFWWTGLGNYDNNPT